MRKEGYYWLLLQKKDSYETMWTISEWKYNHWCGIEDLERKGWFIKFADSDKLHPPGESIKLIEF